jgi:hypothetical protein
MPHVNLSPKFIYSESRWLEVWNFGGIKSYHFCHHQCFQYNWSHYWLKNSGAKLHLWTLETKKKRWDTFQLLFFFLLW